MVNDYLESAKLQLASYVEPGEHLEIFLEAAKANALIAQAEQLKRIADVLEYVKDKGEALLEDKE